MPRKRTDEDEIDDYLENVFEDELMMRPPSPQPDDDDSNLKNPDDYDPTEDENLIITEDDYISDRKKTKRKMSPEERARRMAAYEENKRKYSLGMAEKVTMGLLVLGSACGVIAVMLLQDKIWPPPEVREPTTRVPSSSPSMAPSTFSPSLEPSISMRPTYTGYRDTVILENLQSITPFLPPNGEQLDDSTPQGKAAKFIIYNDPFQVRPYQTAQILQRYALVTLFYATQGSNWNSATNWLSDVHVCKWRGLYCGDDTYSLDEGYVTKILLPNNNMVGSIPSEIGTLVNLTDVSFMKSNLKGKPLSLFLDLAKLISLDLRLNQFDGGLLDEIGAMKSLELLYLEGNQFNGTITKALADSTSLVAITLHRNNFTGVMPSEICAKYKDFTADCRNNAPINCTCCPDPFNQCY